MNYTENVTELRAMCEQWIPGPLKFFWAHGNKAAEDLGKWIVHFMKSSKRNALQWKHTEVDTLPQLPFLNAKPYLKGFIAAAQDW